MAIAKNKPMSAADIESQESLTLKKLELLSPRNPNISWVIRPEYNKAEWARPTANFVDLMDWTVKAFSEALSKNTELQKLVHNRIIIDGQFLTFCEEQKVSVECLYKDSIVSWKSDTGFEKFFVQGVFLIKTKTCEFLHAALFHKGNQNEDEVSFFIIVSNDNFEKYIEFRNQFDTWSRKRDRGSLHIHVVDGDDLPYTKDHSWEDLFLPTNIKTDIKGLVESFLGSEDFYRSKKIPWKRGFLMYGEPGNGKTSIIRTIISNYDFKPVTIIPEANNEMIRDAFSYAEEQSPALLYFEDLDSLFDKGVDISTFLNLMDGLAAKNGILVIATANNIKKLKTNITNRPSRFDRKFEIPLPNQEMAVIYLKKWFGSSVSLIKIKSLARIAVQSSFSYAYLKDLYISSMFEAIAHNRKLPNEKDIDSALKSLLRDKNKLNSGINTDKYLK